MLKTFFLFQIKIKMDFRKNVKLTETFYINLGKLMKKIKQRKCHDM